MENACFSIHVSSNLNTGSSTGCALWAVCQSLLFMAHTAVVQVFVASHSSPTSSDLLLMWLQPCLLTFRV